MTKDAEFNLWHYTTGEGLRGILSDQTLWATDYRCLNDESEFIHSKLLILQALLPEVISKIKEICKTNPDARKVVELDEGVGNTAKKEIGDAIDIIYDSMLNPPHSNYSKPFVLSFCKVSKKDRFKQGNGLLSQWRGYGKDGGYALIFDLSELIAEFSKERKVFYYGVTLHDSVVYDTSKPNDITKDLDAICEFAFGVFKDRVSEKKCSPSPENYMDSLLRCMAFLKHKGFGEETEYRLCIIAYYEKWQKTQYFENDDSKNFKEIKMRNNSGTFVPYIELFKDVGRLPIKGICVGPHREKKERAELIKTYLKSIALDEIEVFCSEIPYIGSK